jgi:hypothetical protein
MTWRWAIMGLALLAGCQTGKSGVASNPDPLFGQTAPPIQATPLAGNPAVATGTLGQPTANTQPLAQPTIASPAVLASGGYSPLAGGQDLRIGTPPLNAGNRVLPRSQTPPGVIAAVTADPDYGKLRDAVSGVVPLDAAGNHAGSSSPTGHLGGLEQTLNAIAAYNPKWHKLENAGAGSWRFSCSIPDRNEPNKSRTYEGEGVTAMAAVQGVLDRIGQDR